VVTTHIEINDAERHLEVLAEALANGRLSKVVLCRQGIPAARLVKACPDATIPSE
jgi:hypothetical protein